MPYGRRTRTMAGRSRRRAYTRKRQVSARRSRYVRRYRRYRRPLTGFPRSKTVRMKYCTTLQIDPSLGSVFKHAFRANSVFDPDGTGVGTQPTGFDEWMAHYNHFTVTGAKIKITPLFSTSVESADAGYWGIVLTGDSTDIDQYTSGEEIMMSYRGQTHSIAGRYTNMGTKIQKHLYKQFSTRKFFRNRNPIDQSQYRGNASSNPTEQAFFILWYSHILSNNPAAAQFLVEIDYVVAFHERKLLPVS